MQIREWNGFRDTVWWGYFLLGTTWIVFVLGIGGVCGTWEWSLSPIRSAKMEMVTETLYRLTIGNQGRRGIGHERVLQFSNGSHRSGGSMDMDCLELGWNEILSS